MIAGFLIGLVAGASFGVALGGMLAMRGREDAEWHAFQSGVDAEKSRAERHSVRPVEWEDLQGDEDTELGHWRA